MSIAWLSVFLDFPIEDYDRGIDFWCAVTGTRRSAARGPGGRFMTLLPADGDAYLRVQRIDEGIGGCHLDLLLDPTVQSLDAACARAMSLGARLLSREDDRVLLASPGGFAFCLVPWDGEQRVPSPAVFAGGDSTATGVSRVHHFCLDIPAWNFDAECTFWAELTSWPVHQASVSGFSYLAQEGPKPVELLFQRRQSAEPEDLVTAHLDVACSDLASLTAAHAAAGARIVSEHEFWVTLTDPVGREYCLVQNDSLTG